MNEYAVKYYRPYNAVHSDVKKPYMVKCGDDGFPWIVCASPFKGGPSGRSLVVQQLTCAISRLSMLSM
jgi:hypothetical protein